MNTDNIKINTQSSIKLTLNKIIYFDPYKIKYDQHDADIIFITHNHYDHMCLESINKIKNENTIIIAPKSIKKEITQTLPTNRKIYLKPNEEINVEGISVKTILAYNIEKPFHPRKNDWLGYIIKDNNISYYIAGDTDKTHEAENVKCDIALIPIGGYYTMDVEQATELIKKINPKIAIPTHYGSIIGDITFGKKLKDNLSNTKIEVIEKIQY